MNKRSVLLYSSGLDSLLAFLIMRELSIDVYPMFINTPFYNKSEENIKQSLQIYGVNVEIVHFDAEYVDMVKNPLFGYGKNLNPCIDCRIFMYKKAKVFMNQANASFIVTGEVLGQRPMSQRSLSVLKLIEKHADVKNIVLRPLSAKLLEPTEMEKEGIVERDKLLNISGRSRKCQMELAKRYSLNNFESPAGGCLLTDKAFSRRLRILLRHDLTEDEINTLSIGRHFIINNKHFVVSRNERETNIISEFKNKLPFLKAKNDRGASGIFFEKPSFNEVETTARILKRYSKNADAIEYIFKDVYNSMHVSPLDIDSVESMIIK